jgi:hypothetical protein
MPKMPKFIFALRTSAWVEIVCFFLILYLISYFLGTSANFYQVSPHPFWILIILISTQYGSNEGLLAALISTLALLLLGPIPPQNILQDKFEHFLLLAKLPILWFATAIILGELRLRQIHENEALKKASIVATEREKTIAESYKALQVIKERLEIRVASEMSTALMAIASFRELEGGGKEGLIKGTINLVKTLISPEKCSVYFLERDELKRAACDGWDEKDRFAEKIAKGSPLFQEIAINKREISILSDPLVLGEDGVLAAPIVSNNKVFGMIKIESIPFSRLKTEEIESLGLIGQWVGSNFANLSTQEAL